MSRRQKRDARFVEWLLEVLDQQRSPKNAFWVDKEERIFAVRWVNAKCRFWTKECIELFKLWRDESPRTWRPNNEDEKQMKTNFRMNLKPPNFIELPKREDYKVFKVNKTTTEAMDREQEEIFTQPAELKSQTFPHNFREMNDPIFKPGNLNYGKSTQEFRPFPNNPTGIMPPMNDDPYINNWMNNVTSTNEPPCWNMNLNVSNTNSSDVFNGFFDSSHQDYFMTEGMSEYNNSLVPNFETTSNNYKPQQTDCLMALETSGYPGCIPELLPCNQGNITCYNPSQYAPETDLKILTHPQQNITNSHEKSLETTMNSAQLQNTELLRHSLIPSPTDSGYMERSSTGSFSSVWSCEGMSYDDICPILTDSVF